MLENAVLARRTSLGMLFAMVGVATAWAAVIVAKALFVNQSASPREGFFLAVTFGSGIEGSTRGGGGGGGGNGKSRSPGESEAGFIEAARRE